MHYNLMKPLRVSGHSSPWWLDNHTSKQDGHMNRLPWPDDFRTPGSRVLIDTAIQHLKNCPVHKADIKAAEDILGPDLGALKGKTVHQPK